MLLRDYINDLFQGREFDHKEPLRVDIVNCETGEVYFSGSIGWCYKEFISDKLEFVEHDEDNTILFKELK